LSNIYQILGQKLGSNTKHKKSIWCFFKTNLF
jgi:hypothetical protein